MTALLAGAAAAAALLLARKPRPRLTAHAHRSSPAAADPRRRRAVLAVLAGVGAGLFLGGPAAPIAGLLAAAAAWTALGRVQPAHVRRDRARATRDLPHLVRLLAAGLRSGAAPGDAVRLACSALPGPAAQRLAGTADRLALGVDPARVWSSLAGDDALAPLGRTLVRAHETGAPVAVAVDRLADELERVARGQVEDRARAVGVRAALPLGLCLLPSFLLLGIVPLVAGLLAGVAP